MPTEELLAVLKADISQFRTEMTTAGQVSQKAAADSTKAMLGMSQTLRRLEQASTETAKAERVQAQGTLELAKAQRTASQTATEQARATRVAAQAAAETARAEKLAAQAVHDHARAQTLLQGQTQQTHQGLQSLLGPLGQFRGALAAVGVTLGGLGLAVFVREAVEMSTRVTALTTAFTSITGSSLAAGQTLAFLRAEAQRLGVNFLSAAEGMRGMLAAAKGTAIEGQGVRTIFTAIAEAGRVMNLGNEQIGRLFTGLQQIMGKGVIQAEEWRQQISEALPQATQVLARALGVTTQELFKMIEAGRLGLPELVRFAEQLRREVAGGVADAAKTFQAEMARLGNSTQEFLAVVGDLVTKSPGVIEALRAIGGAISAMTDAIRAATPTLVGLLNWMGQATARGIELAQQDFFPRPSDQLNKELIAAQRNIDGLTKELASFQAIADSAWRRYIYDTAAAAGLTIPLEDQIASLTQQVDAAKKSFDALRVSRMSALRVERGLPALTDERPMEFVEEDFRRVLRRSTDTQRQRLAGIQGFDLNETTKILERIKVLNETLIVGMVGGQKLTADQIALTNQERAKQEKLLAQIRDPGAKERGQDEKRLRREALQEEEQLRKEAQRLTMDRGKAYLQQVEDEVKQEERLRQESFDLTMERGRAQNRLDDEQRAADDKRRKAQVEADTALIDAQFSLREVYAQTTAERLALLDEYAKALVAAGVDEEKVAADVMQQTTRIVKSELQEQQRAWQQMAENVQNILADKIFDVFSGRIRTMKDLLSGLKDTFLRLLAEMAAKSLTTNILGFLQQGSAQLFGGGAPRPGVSTATEASAAVEQLRQGFGGFQASGLTADAEALHAQQTIQGFRAQGQTQGLVGGAGMAAGGLTTFAGGIGTAAAGVGLGITTTSLINEGLGNQKGGGMKGALSGAAGGAVAGAVVGSIIPGIGTAIGAVAGAIIGAVAGGLIKGATDPFLEIKASKTVIGMQDELLTVLSANIKATGKGLPGSMAEVEGKVGQIVTALMQPILDQVNAFSPTIRHTLAGQLQTMAKQFDVLLEASDFTHAKNQGKEALEEFLTQKMPALVEEAFGPLTRVLRQLQPLFNDLDAAVVSLKQQQEQLQAHFTAARQGLVEALMTPAQLFERRQETLRERMAAFRAAPDAEQVRLAPEITALLGEVFQRATPAEVLGQDRAELQRLQHDLLGLLSEVERESLGGLDAQIAVGERQLEVLSSSLGHLESIDAELQAAQRTLEQLNSFMQASFAGSFQEGGYVEKTGFALVHRGERVFSVHEAPVSISLTVHSAAPTSAGLTQDIEKMVVERILPEIRRRQRFGQV